MQLGFIVPIKYLDTFASQSDFHLILPHILETNEKYLNFYREKSRRGDFIIVDNSVFELGKSYPDEKLLRLASEVEADEIIVPEIIGDFQKSLKKAEQFLRDPQIPRDFSISITVQGNSFDEMKQHYKEILKRFSYLDTISIPFAIDCDIPGAPKVKSKTLQRVINRTSFIDRLLEKGIIDYTKKHHLLGLSDGVELKHYSSSPERYRFIRSNDSSSAFTHGSNLIRYTEKGLPCEKLKEKLDFKMNKELKGSQIESIQYNINMLKKFAGIKEE